MWGDVKQKPTLVLIERQMRRWMRRLQAREVSSGQEETIFFTGDSRRRAHTSEKAKKSAGAGWFLYHIHICLPLVGYAIHQYFADLGIFVVYDDLSN